MTDDVIAESAGISTGRTYSQLWFLRLESWSRDVLRLVFKLLVFWLFFGHKISVSK